MAEILNNDDLTDPYLAQRSQTKARSTVQDFMRERQQRQERQAPQREPAEPSPDEDGETEGQIRQIGGDPVTQDPDYTEFDSMGAGTVPQLGRVARDVGQGAVEAPRQFIGGVSDFVHNVFSAADSLGDWLNENVADLKFEIPDTGIGPLDQLIQDPAVAIAGPGRQAEPPAPGTVVGQTSEGRPIVVNEDGGFSTEIKQIVEVDGKHMVIPTMFDGKVVDIDEAIERVRQAGMTDPETGREIIQHDTHAEAEAEERELSARLEGDAGIRAAREQLEALNEPLVGEARSVTGSFVREAARFLTGFQAAGRVLGTGTAGFASLPAGAVSDFLGQDPDAKRLADLWTGMDLPENVLTDYLQSDPTDSEPEKRFKNALEGAGIGALTEGVLLAGRLARSRFRAGREAQRVGLEAADELAGQPQVKPEDLAPLGDFGPDAPLVSVRQADETTARLTPEPSVQDIGAAVSTLEETVKAKHNLRKLSLSIGRGNVMRLNLIEVAPENLGTGVGTAAMKDITDFADQNGLVLALTPEARESTVGGVRALKRFYKSLGFVENKGRNRDDAISESMIRKPIPTEKVIAAAEATETGVPDAVTARGVAGAARDAGEQAAKQQIGEPRLVINFARMDTPDNLKQVFRDTAEAFSGSIDEARRGKITQEETARMAERLGMSPQDLISRRRGEAFNAEEIKAAGVIMDSATEKLFELAERAAAPTASTVDQYMFRKMIAVHHAVQAEFLGVVAEAGRALNAIKIAQGGGTAETGRAITSLVEGMGGEQVGQALAQRLMMLRQAGTPERAINQFVRKGAFATSMDAIKTFWINALLSNPTTHIVNTASNSLVIVQQMYERLAAEGVSQLFGANGAQGVAQGEAAAMLFGLKSGLWDAFTAAGRTLRSGESEIASALNKIDIPRQFNRGASRPISAQAFDIEGAGPLANAVDYIGAAVEVPGRLLMTEDEFFKTVGYRMELSAQAFRRASAEGLQGEELGKAVARYMAEPSEAMRLAAADAALYNTFTNSTEWFGRALSNLRSAGGEANPIVFIMPFLRTPLNIARYAFERSPVAPLVRQWRADIAAGGARADLAVARMTTGSTIMLLAADLAQQGIVSGRGPSDAGEREAMQRQGWQPYSIKVGDRWYSYNRADPFGMTMGFAADFHDALTRGDVDPDDVDEWQEVMAGMVASVAQVSISKTYMSGMASFFEMMGDPTRYSPGEVNRFIGSFVPAGVAGVERLVDPVTREANDPYEQIVSRLPGLSERLTPRRDLWGKEMKPDSGLGILYDTYSPVYARRIHDSPVDREIVRLVADVRRIKKKTGFQGVDVNFRQWPKVYDAYVRLAGNELKHPAWELGAKDLLDEIISGGHDLSETYALKSEGKDGGKAEFIRKTVRDFRNLAQQAIMNDPEFSEFARHIRQRQAEKRRDAVPEAMREELGGEVVIE